jgi:hypothetical protein
MKAYLTSTTATCLKLTRVHGQYQGTKQGRRVESRSGRVSRLSLPSLLRWVQFTSDSKQDGVKLTQLPTCPLWDSFAMIPWPQEGQEHVNVYFSSDYVILSHLPFNCKYLNTTLFILGGLELCVSLNLMAQYYISYRLL